MTTNPTSTQTAPSPVYISLDLFELLDICETLADELMEYANKSRQHLRDQCQTPAVHYALNGLLFELVNLLIEDLLTPRFERV